MRPLVFLALLLGIEARKLADGSTAEHEFYRGLKGLHSAPLRSKAHPRTFTHKFDHTDSAGRRTALDYKVVISESTFVLDDRANVETFECTKFSIMVRLSEPMRPENLLHLRKGVPVLATPSMGTRSRQKELQEGIMRQIVDFTISRDGLSIEIFTKEYEKIEDAFESARITFRADDCMDPTPHPEDLPAQYLRSTKMRADTQTSSLSGPYIGINLASITSSGSVSSYDSKIKNREMTLFSDSGITATCVNCYAYFRPSITVTYDFGIFSGIKQIKVEFAGDMGIGLNLRVTIKDGSWDKTITLIPGTDVPIPGFSFSILGLVTVGFTIRMDLNGGFSITSKGTLSVQTGGTYGATAGFIAQYLKDSGLSMERTWNPAAPTYNSPAITGNLSVTPKLSLKPTATVSLKVLKISMMEASAEIEGYVQAELNGKPGTCSFIDYALSWGVNLNVLAQTLFTQIPLLGTVIGLGFKDVCAPSSCSPYVLWQHGPVQLATGCINKFWKRQDAEPPHEVDAAVGLRGLEAGRRSSADRHGKLVDGIVSLRRGSVSCSVGNSTGIPMICSGARCSAASVDTCALGSVITTGGASLRQVMFTFVAPINGTYTVSVESWTGVGASFAKSLYIDDPCGAPLAASPLLDMGMSVAIVIGGASESCGVLSLAVSIAAAAPGSSPQHDATIWVSSVTGKDGAVGSEAAPLKSLAEAVRLAPLGGTIVLVNGTYVLDQELTISRSLTIVSEFSDGTVTDRMRAFGTSTMGHSHRYATVGTAYGTIIQCAVGRRAIRVASGTSIKVSFVGLTFAGCGGDGLDGGVIAAAGDFSLSIRSCVFRPVQIIDVTPCFSQSPYCVCFPTLECVSILAAGSHGAAVSLSGGDTTISDSLFLQLSGGAISAAAATVGIKAVFFWQNSIRGADTRGIVSAKVSSVVTIDDSSFRNNTAVSSNGGALSVASGSRVSISTSDFSLNVAADGAAVYANKGEVTMYDCKLTNNFVSSTLPTAASGAVIAARNQTTLTIASSLLSDNSGPAVDITGASFSRLVSTQIFASVVTSASVLGANLQCSDSLMETVSLEVTGGRNGIFGTLSSNLACTPCSGCPSYCGACPMCGLCTPSGNCDTTTVPNRCVAAANSSTCFNGVCDAVSGACNLVPIFMPLSSAESWPTSRPCGFFETFEMSGSIRSGGYMGSIDRTWVVGTKSAQVPTVFIIDSCAIGPGDTLTISDAMTGFDQTLSILRGPLGRPLTIIGATGPTKLMLKSVSAADTYPGVRVRFFPAAYPILRLRIVLHSELPASAVAENTLLHANTRSFPENDAGEYPTFSADFAADVSLAMSIPTSWVRPVSIRASSTVSIDVDILPDPYNRTGNSPVDFAARLATAHEAGTLSAFPYLSSAVELFVVDPHRGSLTPLSSGSVSNFNAAMKSGFSLLALIFTAVSAFIAGLIAAAIPLAHYRRRTYAAAVIPAQGIPISKLNVIHPEPTIPLSS